MSNFIVKMGVLSALLLILTCVVFVTPGAAEPLTGDDNTPALDDIEQERQKLVQGWGNTVLVQPQEVTTRAKAILSRPLNEQPIEDLKDLAAKANEAANLVGFLLDEYADYYRDNYRYEFIQTKVAPFHDSYVRKCNELRGYRNQAYFNLAMKHKEKGQALLAFFYFRDAFRLSVFVESEGDHMGFRYKAEIEMKKLLGIDDIGTFVYWE